MSKIPSLPREVSADGREIWDWAAKLSAEVQRRDDIRKLSIQIRNAETQCGSCESWMTRSCPREVHSNRTGRSVGPSSQSIKCDKFRMTYYSARELETAKAKLIAMSQSPHAGKTEGGEKP